MGVYVGGSAIRLVCDGDVTCHDSGSGHLSREQNLSTAALEARRRPQRRYGLADLNFTAPSLSARRQRSTARMQLVAPPPRFRLEPNDGAYIVRWASRAMAAAGHSTALHLMELLARRQFRVE